MSLNNIINALNASVNSEIKTLDQKRDTLQRFLNLAKDVQGMIETDKPDAKLGGYERGVSFVSSQKTVEAFSLDAIKAGLSARKDITDYVSTRRKTTDASVATSINTLTKKGIVRNATPGRGYNSRATYVLTTEQTTQRR